MATGWDSCFGESELLIHQTSNVKRQMSNVNSIIGHQRQWQQLTDEINQGKLTHAYLFTGPGQVGKFTVARAFAALLQGQNANRLSSDLILMEDKGESIKINEIRQLSQTVSLTRHGQYRLVLIENAERMPAEAQNAFLKTLEEPHPNTLFILTTSHLGRLLPTIQSRTRLYHFSTLSDTVIKQALNEKGIDEIRQNEILRLAQGSPGLAIQMADQPDFFIEQRKWSHRIDLFLKKNDVIQKFAFIDEIEKDKQQVNRFLDAFARHLRYMMTGGLSEIPLKEMVKQFDVLEKTRYLIERNVNKKLALENLMLATEK